MSLPVTVHLVAEDGLRRDPCDLSPAEHRRAGSFTDPIAAARFRWRRSVLRHVLADELGIPPAQVPLTSAAGEPVVASSGLSVSQSATPGWTAVAVARDRHVGVDIERADRVPAGELAGLAGLLTAQEQRWIDASARGAIRRFLTCWTIREATVKALGTGFTAAAERVRLERSETTSCSRWTVSGPAGADRLQLAELDGPTPLVGAVAFGPAHAAPQLEVIASAGSAWIGRAWS